jgi:hypothetical protein
MDMARPKSDSHAAPTVMWSSSGPNLARVTLRADEVTGTTVATGMWGYGFASSNAFSIKS